MHTGLLQNAGAVSTAISAEILRLAPGGRVRISERPISYAESPEVLTGVDCTLAAPPAVRSAASARSPRAPP
ncbi:hypothetical protein ACFQ1L_15070 [Phytohabitans flavus]|uniref:hypothetical protein n=1 Tax=Phytohabitans flavus TaxID=1076124 RepID=UPI00362D4412